MESITINTSTSSCAGDSLLQFLDLKPDCFVLIIGAGLNYWHKLFRNTLFKLDVPDKLPDSTVPLLIIYRPDHPLNTKAFTSSLQKIKCLLPDNGKLLVFVENNISFNIIKKIVKGNIGALSRCFMRQYPVNDKILHRAGFPHVVAFFSLPSFNKTEELVVVGSNLLDVPSYSHPILRAAANIGKYRLVSDGIVYCASSDDINSSIFLKQINYYLADALGMSQVRCNLERADIRLRGAFVLFLNDSFTGSRYIARIVSNGPLKAILDKNHMLLIKIRNNRLLSDSIQKLLPSPLVRFEYSESAIYVETMLKGVIAWKIKDNHLKEMIFQNAVNILVGIHKLTNSVTYINTDILSDMFSDDIYRINNATFISAKMRGELTDLVERLMQLLNNRNISLSLSHGDFGFGNILVNPQSTEVEGVIDWDTARYHDFPLVDFYNLVVQSERDRNVCGARVAFQSAVNGLLTNKYKVHISRFQEFGECDDIEKIALYICFLRYMTRALQYPVVFVEEQTDYLEILNLLKYNLPL